MSRYDRADLSRREFQIMEAIYRDGPSTAAEVRQRLDDPPGNSSVRKLLEILEEKGLIYHERQGPRYVYHPIVPRRQASRSALSQVVATFFGGSKTRAAAALLGLRESDVTDELLDSIADRARSEPAEGRAPKRKRR